MFGQMMQPQQGLEQQGVPETPTSLAGLLIMSGVTPQDAYVQGAKIFRDQEHARIEQQKLANRQQQLAAASEILARGGSLSDLLKAGIDNPAILGALPQPQWVPDKSSPQGGRFVTPNGMPNQTPPMQSNMPGVDQVVNTSVPNQKPSPKYDEFDTSELGTKARNAVKIDRIKRGDEYAAKTYDQASRARATMHTAKQLETIIPKIFSGEQLDPETKETWSNRLGINPEQVTAGQIFTGEVSNLIGEIEREVQDGRSTDAAAKIIIDAKPKKGNSEKANLSLIRGIIARSASLDERGAALAKWQKEGRDPIEFNQTWANYERKHPFISLAKDGTVKVNEGNLDKWRKVIFGEEIGEVNDAPEEAEEPEYIRAFKKKFPGKSL